MVFNFNKNVKNMHNDNHNHQLSSSDIVITTNQTFNYVTLEPV